MSCPEGEKKAIEVLGQRILELEKLKREWDAGEWDQIYTRHKALSEAVLNAEGVTDGRA
jgi:hypothetical protein